MLVLRYLSPRRFKVKASRPIGAAANNVATEPHRGWFNNDGYRFDRWWAFGLATDEKGRQIETAGKFVGLVDGQSLRHRDFVNGSTFVADYLSLDEAKKLQKGDIVVVNDRVSPDANWQYCLRSIRSVAGDAVDYEEDASGSHDQHPVGQIVALVTRVIPPAQPKSFKSLISSAA